MSTPMSLSDVKKGLKHCEKLEPDEIIMYIQELELSIPRLEDDYNNDRFFGHLGSIKTASHKGVLQVLIEKDIEKFKDLLDDLPGLTTTFCRLASKQFLSFRKDFALSSPTSDATTRGVMALEGLLKQLAKSYRLSKREQAAMAGEAKALTDPVQFLHHIQDSLLHCEEKKPQQIVNEILALKRSYGEKESGKYTSTDTKQYLSDLSEMETARIGRKGPLQVLVEKDITAFKKLCKQSSAKDAYELCWIAADAFPKVGTPTLAAIALRDCILELATKLDRAQLQEKEMGYEASVSPSQELVSLLRLKYDPSPDDHSQEVIAARLQEVEAGLQEAINNKTSNAGEIIRLIVKLQSITKRTGNFFERLSSINTTEGKGVLQVLLEKPDRDLESLKASFASEEPEIKDYLRRAIKDRLQEVINEEDSTAEEIIKLVVELRYATNSDSHFLESLSTITTNTEDAKGVLRVIIEKPERNLAKFKKMCDEQFLRIKPMLYQKAFTEFSHDPAPTTRASKELGQLIYELAKANPPRKGASEEVVRRYNQELDKASALGYDYSKSDRSSDRDAGLPVLWEATTMKKALSDLRDNDSSTSKTPTFPGKSSC